MDAKVATQSILYIFSRTYAYAEFYTLLFYAIFFNMSIWKITQFVVAICHSHHNK